MAHLALLAGGTNGELHALASLLAQVCAFPAISVVAATLPFWGACLERQRNIMSAQKQGAGGAEDRGLGGGGARGSVVLEEGVLEQMLGAVVARLGSGGGGAGMTVLDEEEYVDADEYRQAAVALRARVVDIVRRAAALQPLALLRLAARSFVVALQKMAAGIAGVGVGEDGGKAEGELDPEEGGESGGGSDGLTEGGIWLKILECIVEALPFPTPGDAVAACERAEGARGEAAGIGGSCREECSNLVQGLLQTPHHEREDVNVLVVRALGSFSALYPSAPDTLLAAVVRRLLLALADVEVSMHVVSQ